MKLLIPTRNRPNSLRSVLTYLKQFYPDQPVLIADGSFASYKDAVRAVVDECTVLPVRLLDYPADLPLPDRYVEALEQDDGQIFALCPDDDYPLVDVLAECAQVLRKRPVLAGVMTSSLGLRPMPDGQLDVRFLPCTDYDQKNVQRRLRRYGTYHCVTNFGVFTKGHLLNRMRYFRNGYTAGFGDFEIAVTDLLNGRFSASPMPAYLRTINPHHSKLRRAGMRLSQLSEYPKLMARLTQEGCRALPDLDEDFVTKLIDLSIARFVGFRYQKEAVAEAARLPIFEKEPVAMQLRFYNDLFTDGTQIRARYLPQLRWAVQSLRDEQLARDNFGESSIYETLEDMYSSDTP